MFSAEKVVVTQPAAGEFKAFSAVCTHLQCLVDQVASGTIDCPCHGSQFSVKNGSVVTGPATQPAADPVDHGGGRPGHAGLTVKSARVSAAKRAR